jgi:multisubunit Na+/H+ antiporter MnhC subunit
MVVAIDMAGSARLWRVAVSSGLFGPMAFDRSAAAVANHSDPAYSTAILAGLVITLATAAVLLMLAARERQRNRAMARVHTS